MIAALLMAAAKRFVRIVLPLSKDFIVTLTEQMKRESSFT